MNKIPLSVSWSGGKDSAMMLHKLLQDPSYKVISLHTVLSAATDRVSMHGISKELIQAQANAIGLPLDFITMDTDSTNASYELVLAEYYTRLISLGIRHIGFGDIFLEDLKSYRDTILARHRMTGVYPLWQKNTTELAHEFIAENFKTILCSVNVTLFKEQICGHVFDYDLLNQFDSSVDPCGENGEFHTYVLDGPFFRKAIAVEIHQIQSHTYTHRLSSGEEQCTEFEFADLRLGLE